jgi:hypothetical protein
MEEERSTPATQMFTADTDAENGRHEKRICT